MSAIAGLTRDPRWDCAACARTGFVVELRVRLADRIHDVVACAGCGGLDLPTGVDLPAELRREVLAMARGVTRPARRRRAA